MLKVLHDFVIKNVAPVLPNIPPDKIPPKIVTEALTQKQRYINYTKEFSQKMEITTQSIRNEILDINTIVSDPLKTV